MNELALFAGAGGGILGTHLAGITPVAAVEIDPYCREVLLRRQDDGVLPLFPIWDDIKTFDGAEWRGVVDIVTAGFPCQPFSSAAHGHHVAQDLSGEVIRIAREVRPTFILLENVWGWKAVAVDGFCSHSFDAGAASVGAPHLRKRRWVLAHAYHKGKSDSAVDEEASVLPPTGGRFWWKDHPGALGMDDGLAYRVDRLKALGNGQVPPVVQLVLEIAGIAEIGAGRGKS